jgi:hypothetical protein
MGRDSSLRQSSWHISLADLQSYIEAHPPAARRRPSLPPLPQPLPATTRPPEPAPAVLNTATAPLPPVESCGATAQTAIASASVDADAASEEAPENPAAEDASLTSSVDMYSSTPVPRRPTAKRDQAAQAAIRRRHHAAKPSTPGADGEAAPAPSAGGEPLPGTSQDAAPKPSVPATPRPASGDAPPARGGQRKKTDVLKFKPVAKSAHDGATASAEGVDAQAVQAADPLAVPGGDLRGGEGNGGPSEVRAPGGEALVSGPEVPTTSSAPVSSTEKPHDPGTVAPKPTQPEAPHLPQESSKPDQPAEPSIVKAAESSEGVPPAVAPASPEASQALAHPVAESTPAPTDDAQKPASGGEAASHAGAEHAGGEGPAQPPPDVHADPAPHSGATAEPASRPAPTAAGSTVQDADQSCSGHASAQEPSSSKTGPGASATPPTPEAPTLALSVPGPEPEVPRGPPAKLLVEGAGIVGAPRETPGAQPTVARKDGVAPGAVGSSQEPPGDPHAEHTPVRQQEPTCAEAGKAPEPANTGGPAVAVSGAVPPRPPEPLLSPEGAGTAGVHGTTSADGGAEVSAPPTPSKMLKETPDAPAGTSHPSPPRPSDASRESPERPRPLSKPGPDVHPPPRADNESGGGVAHEAPPPLDAVRGVARLDAPERPVATGEERPQRHHQAGQGPDRAPQAPTGSPGGGGGMVLE